VRDLFGYPSAIPPLLDLLMAALRRQGQSALSLRYRGSPRLVEALRTRGFEERPPDRSLHVAAGPSLGAAEIGDPDRRHVLDLDEDV
jgi:hypothetical protein